MLGILHETQINIDYVYRLIQEYSILETAQVFSLLKRHGGLRKRERYQIEQRLCRRRLAYKVWHGGRGYLTRHPQILPEGRYMEQITCFWVLLDYLHRVDNHYAKGTYSRIALEIEGRDYDIIHVPQGGERLCNANMEQGGETRYLVLLYRVEQMPLVVPSRVHAFALLNDDYSTEYYAVKQEDSQ